MDIMDQLEPMELITMDIKKQAYQIGFRIWL